MKRMTSRPLSLLLAVCMMLSLVPSSAKAATYGISGVEAGDSVVRVDVTASSSCTLYVAFYSGDGQMLQTKMVSVSGKTSAQQLSVSSPSGIPDAFSVEAFLLDSKTMAPLCDSMEGASLEPLVASAPLDKEHIATGTMKADDGTTYESEYVDNQIIVVAKDGVSRSQIETLVKADGGSIVGYIEPIGYYQIQFATVPGLTGLNSTISKWTASPLVEEAYLNEVSYCKPNASVTNPKGDWGESDFSEDYPSGNNWGFEAIYANSAQQILTNYYKSKGKEVPEVTVGVIDGNFDTRHPDLKFKDVYSFSVSRIVSVSSADIAARAEKAGTSSQYGNLSHGTHVAGIIAADGNNTKGIAGVAVNPIVYGFAMNQDGDDEFLSLTTSGYSADDFGLMTSFSFLIAKGAKVINYSAGYALENGAEQRAKVTSKSNKVVVALSRLLANGYDFVIVTSAGNGGYEVEEKDAQYANEFAYIKDSKIKNRIIVVGAALVQSGQASFAFEGNYNYGKRIDVVAPGERIYSTVPSNQIYTKGRDYVVKGGTSMASPYVAGVAALLYEADPTLTGDKVKKIILDTADIPVNGTDSQGNASPNMVNAKYAVSNALKMEYKKSGEDVNGNHWEYSSGKLTISGTSALNGKATYEDVILSDQINLSDFGFPPNLSDFIGPQSFECYYYQNKEKAVTYYPWHRYIDNMTSIEIKEGITKIGPLAFDSAEKLTSVTLPNSLTEIGDMAFLYSTKLTKITIPASVTKIGEYAVGYLDDEDTIEGFTIYGYAGTAAETYAKDYGLTFVPLTDPAPSPSPTPSPSPDTPAKGISWSFDESTETLKLTGSGPMEDFTFESSAPWNEPYRYKIKNISIGEGITSIGDHAFYDCTNLTKITIPNSVTSIGDYAFDGCTNLTKITIPNSVTSIGAAAFEYCESLTDITIPNSVASIGENAFGDCLSLTTITIPDGVTSLEEGTFYRCSSLTNIIIPNSVTRIGFAAFGLCYCLTNVYYGGSEAEWKSISINGWYNSCLTDANIIYEK